MRRICFGGAIGGWDAGLGNNDSHAGGRVNASLVDGKRDAADISSKPGQLWRCSGLLLQLLCRLDDLFGKGNMGDSARTNFGEGAGFDWSFIGDIGGGTSSSWGRCKAIG